MSGTWTRGTRGTRRPRATACTYQQIDPVSEQDGVQPDGSIRVGLLFRTDIGLTFASPPAHRAIPPPP
ncbi:hypothetical protein [Streptomyces sp. NPDC002889]|uniref:hypothetical protein n=1 Tax=Streptomyces sp. NPDC002889 TaxID=3364669 RepID=UPI003693210D